MSISISIRIKENCISELQYEKYLESYFDMKCSKKNIRKTCVIYECYFSKYGFTTSFYQQIKEPYNIYDSEILNNEYEYNQEIVFNIDKHRDISIIYNTVLKFSFYIYNKVKTDFLITSDTHNDICLIKSPENEVFSRYPHLLNTDMLNKYDLKIAS
jgi:hypothetical protein